MTSQVVQGKWLKKGGYGRFRGQCVNEHLPTLQIFLQLPFMVINFIKAKVVNLSQLVLQEFSSRRVVT